MNLFEKIALAPSPKKLFYCCKCKKPVESVHCESEINKGFRQLTVYITCHGETTELIHVEGYHVELPLEVFDA